MIEIWLPIPGWGDRYEISDRGRVYSHLSGKIMQLVMASQGRYPAVKLSLAGRTQQLAIHDLVLRVFDRDPQPGEWGRHLNDIKTDNRWPENLAWGTPAENCADRDKNGRHTRGERNGNARLTASQVVKIRSRRAAGEKPYHLAREYGVSYATVHNIVTGHSWPVTQQ